VSNTLLKTLGVSVATLALASFAFGVSAQDKKAPAKKPPPACNSLKAEAACKARDDCVWVSAVMDKAGKKVTRKAYCRAKPKEPAKKK
jgi:hypothetical protein